MGTAPLKRTWKVVLPTGFEPVTIPQSRDAISGAEYKSDVLPIELREDKEQR